MSQARTIALTILNQVRDGRYTLDHFLSHADHQILQLNRADRSLVHALVYGVLRWQSRLDWMIDQLAVKNKTIDPMVRIILQLGLFQLHFLKRIPQSAVVHTAVDLAKTNRRKWAAGFVNGLLRQAIRQTDPMAWPDPDQDPLAYLSTVHAFPRWLISRWLERWGIETTGRICEAINTVPSITLRTNTLRVSRGTLKEAVTSQAETVRETRYSPEGLTLAHIHTPLPQWELFQNGWFQIQSEAAQIVGHYLAPRPGERIWDVCAGLGTKTAHLAQLMKNQGLIVATDIYAEKLKRLDAEMQRLGIAIVQSAQMDLAAPTGTDPPVKYDRILVDAPCSGLGVLQKNPDGKWRVGPEDIHINSQRQLSLMDHCACHLKTNGILVYAVCSLEPEETNAVVEGFLQKHPEFAIHRADLEAIAESDRLLTPQGFLTTIPHLHQMDGFFAAALVKMREG